jgi:radical SAM protein with 4Fe4S-binding SPASM domain
MPPSFRKTLSDGDDTTHPKTIGAKLNAVDWHELIKKSFDLGCRRCQFIGGEPFLYKDGDITVLDLAEFAVELGYEHVEIFTNATLLTDKKIERIGTAGIKIAVSLYSADPDVHDSITQLPGSHKKTIGSLRKLKKAGIQTRVETVAMRQNQHTLVDTQVLIKDIGFIPRSPDPLRPKGRGDNPAIKPSGEMIATYGIKLKPNFKAYQSIVDHYSSSHSCLAGKITITDNGDVLPCIFSRTHVIGNVVDSDLETILLSEAVKRIWQTTKDDVLVCRDCEYRYVCFDCRPLSEAASEGKASYFEAPPPRCSYNPYTGEWAAGVWKVDSDGNPYYDRSAKGTLLLALENKVEVDTEKGH